MTLVSYLIVLFIQSFNMFELLPLNFANKREYEEPIYHFIWGGVCVCVWGGGLSFVKCGLSGSCMGPQNSFILPRCFFNGGLHVAFDYSTVR